jgi:hypothetical protein
MALEIGTGITIGSGISLVPLVPEAGGGTPDITGSLTIGNGFGDLYGYAPGVPQQFIPGHGSLTQNPAGIINAINYSPTNVETVIVFVTGTYTGANGELVVSNGETINGITTFTVKIGAVTQTMSATPEADNRVIIYGSDPFNLVAQNGQTVAVEITLA